MVIEVMKVLRAKKHGKMRKKQQELKENSENQRSSCELEAGNSEPDKDSEVTFLNQFTSIFLF